MSNNLQKDTSDDYLDLLAEIANEDVSGLKKAQISYGNSWKARGGVGAFMMMARKWDRLENRVKRAPTHKAGKHVSAGEPLSPYDIFTHVYLDERAEGVIDDIRDLRRYLLLVEAELRARGLLSDAVHRDNKPEPKKKRPNEPRGFDPKQDMEEGGCH